MISDKQQRQKLRQDLLQRRGALNEAEQRKAADALSQQIRSGLQNHSGSTPKIVAGYFPARGEIDTLPALSWLRSQGCITCLPIMSAGSEGDTDSNQLRFAAFDHNTPMKKGRFNIPAPDVPEVKEKDIFDSRQLDLVLVPLTGFDEHGNRLGMGGGYYDRTFSWRHHEQRQQLFIGVAHECQKLPQVPVQSWDVTLDAVVTDQRWYLPENSVFST